MIQLIKPPGLESDSGCDTWNTIVAAAAGDTYTLRRLLDRDPSLIDAEYWYTRPIHYAVREGHLEAVRILLEGGADPEWNGLHDESLIEMARERGHEAIAQLLDDARKQRGRVAPGEDHPIHEAAEANDLRRVRELLDADPTLVDCGDRTGGTPLHRAVMRRANEVISLLLDRGAEIHAVHSSGRGVLSGWWSGDVQAIDLAIWDSNPLAPSWHSEQTPRLLLARGAAYDLTIAAALGDIDRVSAMLDKDPDLIRQTRASGRRPLPGAVEFGHTAVVRLLLDRGTDPTWPDPGAPRGASLRIATGYTGDREMVELLLAHGADPNSELDSGGTAMGVASPELRPLMIAHGGKLDPWDLTGMDDDEVMRRVKEDPSSAEAAGVLVGVCSAGNRALLVRLLAEGIRVPPVLPPMAAGHLVSNIEMFRLLLASGMNPDLSNWQRQTFLHGSCGGGERSQVGKALELAAILLEAGASITAREAEYRSTPLGWAARNNMPDMVEFLLARGAPTSLPDDQPWATPLAWAERRGHAEIAEILRNHGAAR